MTDFPHRGWLRVAIAFALAVFGVASAQESPYGRMETVDVRDGYSIERATLTERDIPVLLFSKDSTSDAKRPVVFLVHGGGMPDVLQPPTMWAKESWFFDDLQPVPYALADGGILVVLLDTWWAGERFRPEYRSIVRENVLKGVVKGYTETTRDISMLIDALPEVARADPSRIGVTGRSGGAIISLMAAARDDRVTAITAWAGGPDMMTFAYAKIPEKIVNRFVESDPEITALLNEFDPVHTFANMPPAAVFMLNNRNDPAIPVETVEHLYAELKPLYIETPDRLELHIRDPAEPTHAMTETDYQEGCAWLIRWLTE